MPATISGPSNLESGFGQRPIAWQRQWWVVGLNSVRSEGGSTKGLPSEKLCLRYGSSTGSRPLMDVSSPSPRRISSPHRAEALIQASSHTQAPKKGLLTIQDILITLALFCLL